MPLRASSPEPDAENATLPMDTDAWEGSLAHHGHPDDERSEPLRVQANACLQVPRHDRISRVRVEPSPRHPDYVSDECGNVQGDGVRLPRPDLPPMLILWTVTGPGGMNRTRPDSASGWSPDAW